ncbi:DUF4932 domain-containing protein [Winogradskyella aurantiaca]|uniref:DUF4932 domain-containing protein n=1 Tax=Winogradskyella aurantiaca TaxID=2219558 RepID=UPI000E1C4409|nr:DUF4932 domain-containing protein [Winogradskyella aurantiaca]
MKTTVFTLIFSLTLLLNAQKKTVSIEFNKNLDFFGYLVHLGEPGDDDPNHPISIILSNYKDNQSNPLLQEIYGNASDFTFAMFVEFFYNDLPELPFSSDYNLDGLIQKKYHYKSEEDKEALKDLMLLVNRFYRESQFETIWNQLEPHRAKTFENLKNRLPSDSVIKLMESFYEQHFNFYKIVPSLTIWPTAGWGLKNSELSTDSFILGPLQKNFDFTDMARFENLAIHEFGHSFVNHIVLENNNTISNTSSLYEPLKGKMIPQGYNDWENCIIEHFVRASEIIIPELLNNGTQTDTIRDDYINNRGFVSLPFIITQLKHYRLTKRYSYKESVRRTIEDLKERYL